MLGRNGLRGLRLGQFDAGLEWHQLQTKARDVYGTINRDTITRAFNDVLTDHKTRLARNDALIDNIPNLAVAQALQNENDELKSYIKDYEVFGRNMIDPYVPDSAIKTMIEDLSAEYRQAKYDMHVKIQQVSGGVSLIDKQTENIVYNQVKEELTPAMIEELDEKAGGDELYLAQLKQNLFAKMVMEQYAGILGSDVVADIQANIAESEKYLEEAKPTLLDKALESEPVGAILDHYEKVGSPFANIMAWIPRQWKWIIGIGVGLTALVYIAPMAKVAMKAKRKKRRKPKPVMANPYGKGAKYFHIRTYDPAKCGKRYGVKDIGKKGGAKMTFCRPKGKKTSVVQKITVAKKDVPKKHHKTLKRMEVRAEDVKPYDKDYVIDRLQSMGIRI